VTEISELNIPNAMRPVAEEIIGITDEVCAKLLDAEYGSLARQVVAKLARKRPSPLSGGRRATRGRRATWAAAPPGPPRSCTPSGRSTSRSTRLASRTVPPTS
jgi:hypothetical protein